MTETWLPVPLYEGLYEVSDRGRVRSLDREVPHSRYGTQQRKGKILRPQTGYGGYIVVQLHQESNKHTQAVHTLVLTTFISPRPTNYECNHIDGDITNNRLLNLEWVTHQRNIQHAHEIGLSTGHKGEKNGRAKLSNEQIKQIRKSKNISSPELAKQFQVTRHTIWKIRNNQSWKHVK